MSNEYNPVGWFEIPVNDTARDSPLNCTSSGHSPWRGFGCTPRPKARSSLAKNPVYTPSHAGALVYFTASDIDAGLQRVAEIGGKVLNPKTSIGKFGFVGHFEDSEGNRVAVHSRHG